MKERILEEAWKLFFEKGYENTTVDEIIHKCGISKGGFYHHFSAKEDLLNHLAYLFDAQYERLSKEVDNSLSALEKLYFYTENLFRYIEDNVPSDILSLVLSTQVTRNGEKCLLDERRVYFVTLNSIISQGQKNGEFDQSRTVRELVKFYAMQERAILYDWCLCEGQYPLATYGVSMFKQFINGVLTC